MTKEKGLRQFKKIWYINIQAGGKRREFRVGPDKQNALAVRRRLKLMAIDGSLQRKLTEESQAKAATFTYRQAID